jgi:hypothetical protein
LGGRVVEISENSFDSLDLSCSWAILQDTQGNEHFILRKNIIEIVKPA